MHIHDGGHRRHRHRQDPVLASYGSRTFTQNRNDDLPDPQVVQTDRSSHDIYNGIHRSDLVEMDLIHRDIVGFGFCLCQDLKDPQSQPSGPLRQPPLADDLTDLGHPPVLVMVMVIAVTVVMVVMVVAVTVVMGVVMVVMVTMTVVIMMVVMAIGVMMIVFMVVVTVMVGSMSVFMDMAVAAFRLFMMVVVAMEIFHVMIMVLMVLIQNHVEITGIDA